MLGRSDRMLVVFFLFFLRFEVRRQHDFLFLFLPLDNGLRWEVIFIIFNLANTPIRNNAFKIDSLGRSLIFINF
jgi:hypothetical protein